MVELLGENNFINPNFANQIENFNFTLNYSNIKCLKKFRDHHFALL